MKWAAVKKEKRKMRGKNKAGKKVAKKEHEHLSKVKQVQEKAKKDAEYKKQKEEKHKNGLGNEEKQTVEREFHALDRFKKKWTQYQFWS